MIPSRLWGGGLGTDFKPPLSPLAGFLLLEVASIQPFKAPPPLGCGAGWSHLAVHAS